MNNIVIFESGERSVEVRLEGETVWLSLQQLAELFGRDKSVISRHLKNIFYTNELERESVVAKNATTATDGKIYQVEYYNLDAIISVSYRVNSTRATRFRQWATGVLRQHLVAGYSLNQQRLKERGIAFEQALDLLSRTLANQQLVSTEGEAVLGVIADYARSWSLLQGYDEQSLTGQTGKQQDMRALHLDEVLAAIAQLKAELMVRLVEHFLLLKENGG
ncbi:RhuM family protein [Algiphilus sp. W345]|uniref:RhuM family protein n=1 Tax=Banduia mediterranea TaxID=3075609 RepID=A0ABU2WMM2_9GAMM|nr:RhuM family protein [Algiphilus sp. W345]MDT0499132.1 RhuM family protein [Algiphilus sp. W345]